MANHILNLTFNILNNFSTLFPSGLFLVLVSYWSIFTFFITNRDSRKSTNISHTIHIMQVPRWSPLHVHDMAGISAIYYPHHESA
jgi:hypothetical protein